MSAPRVMATLAGALALALGVAPSAHAEATAKCTGTTMTVTIKHPQNDDVPNTAVTATDAKTVTVNAGTTNQSVETCTNDITAIAIEGTEDGEVVTYTGSLAFTVTADLKGGGDEFTANGTQPVNVSGGAADDRLTGGSGADTLNGGDNNDILQGGFGSDDLNGDGGRNTVSYTDRPAEQGINASLVDDEGTPTMASMELDEFTGINDITGGAGDDILEGDAFANKLVGGDGDDTITGLDGNDTLLPGTGGGSNDGGAGATDIDTVSYAEDVPALPAAQVTVTATLGAPGSATVATAGGADTQVLTNLANIIGSPGTDVLTGDTDDNGLDGGAGSDTVTYADRTADHDIVASLTAGIDGEGGEPGEDTDTYTDIENLTGGAGDDKLMGKDAQSNVLDGAGGVDTGLLRGGPGRRNVKATLGGTGGNIAVPTEQDSYPNVENLRGGNGDDVLIGNTSNNTLDGGPDGNDTASYEGRTANLKVSLIDGGGDPLLFEDDTFVAIDNLIGGTGNDTLIGDTQNNRLDGGADGRDTVSYEDRTAAHPIVASLQTEQRRRDRRRQRHVHVDREPDGRRGQRHAERPRRGDERPGRGLRRRRLGVLRGRPGRRGRQGEARRDGWQHRRPGRGGHLPERREPARRQRRRRPDRRPGRQHARRRPGRHRHGVLRGPDGEPEAVAHRRRRRGRRRQRHVRRDRQPRRRHGQRHADRRHRGQHARRRRGRLGHGVLRGPQRRASDHGLAGDGHRRRGRGRQRHVRLDREPHGRRGQRPAHRRRGSNKLTGGVGTDTASYEDRTAGVTAALGETGGATADPDEDDTFVTIENLTGGDGDDVLTGDDNPNRLDGGPGADTLNGLGGADVLVASDDDDTFDGGDGSDTVTFAGIATALTVDLADSSATAGGDDYELTNVENVIGTARERRPDRRHREQPARRRQRRRGHGVLRGPRPPARA